MPLVRVLAACLILALTASSATAQYAPGSIGNGGRMPETMSPGALPPPPTPAPLSPSSPSTSYPNTQSLSRDRIESQGYRVRQITPQNNGSWKADVTRNPVPTRPSGVPSKVIIYPDGRIVEER